MEISTRASSFLKDEGGTVESALVLVPLMILILSILQIALGVLSRNIASNSTQSVITQSGLYSSSGTSPLIAMSSQGIISSILIPLTGGGALYMGEQHHQIPSLTPLLPHGDSFNSFGASIGEGP